MATLEEFQKHKTYTLQSGNKIPAIGFGTWQAKPGEVGAAVKEALNVGYKHIDCALIYENEAEIGNALKKAIDESKVKREDIFITSKLWCSYYKHVEDGIKQTLKNLKLDHVDLYLMHWPVGMDSENKPSTLLPKREDGTRKLLPLDEAFVDAWRDMIEVKKAKKATDIGVSNFNKNHIEELIKHNLELPAVNQIEIHPQLPQDDLIEYCRSKNIVVEAYSPLGSAKSTLRTDEKFADIAKKENLTWAQLALSYGYSRDYVILPKTVNLARVAENAKVKLLSKDVIESITKLYGAKEKQKRYVSPDWGVDIFNWSKK